jgi:hypothetical protein
MSEKRLVLTIDCEREICGDCRYRYTNADYGRVEFLQTFCHIYDKHLEEVPPNPKKWKNHRVDNTLRCTECIMATDAYLCEIDMIGNGDGL